MNNKFYQFNDYYIPKRMQGGIERYIKQGIEPGSFLTAIIENNLKAAVAAADDENLKNIPAYVVYFYNEAPIACWGSPKIMSDWVEKLRVNK